MDIEEIRVKAAQHICKSQKVNAAKYNSKPKEPTIYKVNIKICRCVHRGGGHNKNLVPKFGELYVMRKVLDYDKYVVDDNKGFQIT